ncbi:MAG: sterol desaturase family protein [Bacteroidia bacterium]|nr:sterol desaturase family protein [Bacteroidia bacterium]
MLIFISAPLQTIFICTEILLSNLHDRKFYTIKDTITNLYLMVLNFGLDVLLLAVVTLPILTWACQYHLFTINNSIAYWLVLLVAEDFMFYWEHYFDHRIRFFWAVHATHHSSDFYNLTVGFRSSVFQPLYRFVYFLPLALMGFKALDIMFMYSFTQIYGILIHTQGVHKLGFLEHILATPSHHRVHHASNTKYLDKNMGMVFIFWDKLFGTFQPELSEKEYQKIEYGLTHKLADTGPINTMFHEFIGIADDWKRNVDFKTKLHYTFMPPGWSHDGSRQTSKELQAEELLAERGRK